MGIISGVVLVLVNLFMKDVIVEKNKKLEMVKKEKIKLS